MNTTTYITSDFHFDDKVTFFLSRNRFNSIEEMNEKIIENYNAMVKPRDTCYILGDIGKGKNLGIHISRLNGKKILIMGNHDLLTKEQYLEMGFDEVHEFPIFYNEYVVLSHEPQKIDTDYYINVHGHLHNSTLINPEYINVCIDLNFDKPINIEHILKKTSGKRMIREKFGREWFFQEYEFLREIINEK